MECPRCHNKDITKLYELNGKYYCRDCIKFHRVFIDETRKTDNQLYTPINAQYNLAFTLTSTQMNISHQLVENYKQRKNSLVLAVCGSGKTEIVFELIQSTVSEIISSQNAGLLGVSVLLTIWTASSGFRAVIKGRHRLSMPSFYKYNTMLLTSIINYLMGILLIIRYSRPLYLVI